MIHYSCDRCQRAINPEEEIRYVVRIEVQLAMGDDEEICVELGDEQLAQWEELLDDLEVNAEEAHEAFDECSRSGKNFDLCSNCYREYIANPLAVEPATNIGFSDN
jgi:hypothetical protein